MLAFYAAMGLLPNLFGNLFDEGDFLPLVFRLDDVAFFGGRKAALRAECSGCAAARTLPPLRMRCDSRRFGFSSAPSFEVTRPSTTFWSRDVMPVGRNRRRARSRTPGRSRSHFRFGRTGWRATGSYPPEENQVERKLPRQMCMVTAKSSGLAAQ